MADRPRFFDDLAGVAGGAFSALAGARDELESQVRARIDEAIRKLELVRREELDAVAEMAANARAGQEAAEERLAALEARVAEMIVGAPVAGAAPQPRTDAVATKPVSPASASAVAPGTMPPADGRQQGAAGGKPADASSVTPAAMPPGSGAPGSTLAGDKAP